jgi:hypothetical protein
MRSRRGKLTRRISGTRVPNRAAVALDLGDPSPGVSARALGSLTAYDRPRSVDTQPAGRDIPGIEAAAPLLIAEVGVGASGAHIELVYVEG